MGMRMVKMVMVVIIVKMVMAVVNRCVVKRVTIALVVRGEDGDDDDGAR